MNRETERAVLDRAAREALQGRGQVVALVGEPGVGNSRLTYEFSNSEWAGQFFRRDARAPCLTAACSAFMPIIALLRSYMGIRLGDPANYNIVDRASEEPKELDADFGETRPALLWLLGVTEYSEEWDALDPQIKRERLLAALKRLFISQSKAKPLLLLFEDLHWADVESQAMLDVLVDAIPSERVLLVVTYRDETPMNGRAGRTMR